MRDAALLAVALALCTAGMGWLALAMEPHWGQVHAGRPQPRALTGRLRWLGALALAASLGLCLLVDHASMAALVWVMVLGVSALLVALALSWRPRWVRWLLPLRSG